MSKNSARSACSALIVVIPMIASLACSNKPPDSSGGCTRLAADRAAKDEMFQKGADPVPENRKAALLPLAYFPCDQDYMVPAGLKPSQDDTVIQIPTSTGALRAMRRAGTLEFSIKEQPSKLTAFVDLSDRNLDHLFVMFSDLTSGTETYPAGRYLDLTRNATGVYELDFNRCYQPYCYYNESYECPYPPAENRLKIPIRAGERMKK